MTQSTYLIDLTVNLEQPLTVTPKSCTSTDAKYPNRVPRTTISGEERLQVPASSFRGKLRRSAVSVSRQIAIEDTGEEKPFTLQDHFFSTIGGVKGKGETKPINPEWLDQLRLENPLISLFGAGDPFIQGRLSVPMLVAKTPVVAEISDGVRVNDFSRDPSMISFLDNDNQKLLYAVMEGQKDQSKIKKDIETLERDLKNETDKEQKNEIENNLTELKEILKKIEVVTGGVAVQMPLAGYERIPQGTQLSGRMTMHRSNSAELGFLLKSFEAMSYSPTLGGKISHGCGEISIEAMVSKVSLGSPKQLIGSFVMKPYEGLVFLDNSDQLSAALDDWNALRESSTFNFKKPA
ncbi:hypothetical protein A3715_17490 [Oleiphilus sp. HI0009]|nr:hypothetical protein A3715_17490 [Oleiphilus sp. HI0009]